MNADFLNFMCYIIMIFYKEKLITLKRICDYAYLYYGVIEKILNLSIEEITIIYILCFNQGRHC